LKKIIDVEDLLQNTFLNKYFFMPSKEKQAEMKD